MIDISVHEESVGTWVTIQGRIDGMTCSEIDRSLEGLVEQGRRTFIADLEGVDYVSSAGLRVFLSFQKRLKEVGGEILLFGLAEPVLQIFRLSGFDGLFRMASTREELEAEAAGEAAPSGEMQLEHAGVAFRYVTREAAVSTLRIIGNLDRLASSAYTADDVVRVPADDIRFGTGLATFGVSFDQYKDFFGEALILNRNLFFYPATKQPAVDFVLCPDEHTGLQYPFLHGFGFGGDFQAVTSFEGQDGPVDVQTLVEGLFRISKANILGVVFLAESLGFWGMNLKQVPTSDRRPEDGASIFDAGNFAAWMDFPVEPAASHHAIVGVGIAVRDKAAEPPPVAALFAKESRYHFHAGVLPKEPLSREIGRFEQELDRVLMGLEWSRVQHLLGQTRFSSGLAGIIELKG